MLKRLNCWENYLKVNEKEAIGDDRFVKAHYVFKPVIVTVQAFT